MAVTILRNTQLHITSEEIVDAQYIGIVEYSNVTVGSHLP